MSNSPPQVSQAVVVLWTTGTLLCLAIPLALLSFELSNVLLDLFLHPCLELPAVAKEEQKLQPNKERGQEESLHEVVEKSWGTAFEFSMANELKYPGHYKDATGNHCGCPWIHGVKVVVNSGHADADGTQEAPGHWLHQDIKPSPYQGPDCAHVEREVFVGKPFGQWDQDTGIRSLKFKDI